MEKKDVNNTLNSNKKYFYYLLFLVLIISIGLVKKTFQNDTFYTIKIGELISKNGIDMLDHFSFHNLTYTYPHWLYDLFIYAIYHVGNFKGIYISTIVINMILLFCIFKSTHKITNSYAAPFAVTLMSAIVMGQSYATARAQLVTYVLFVLEIYLIELFIKNRNKKYLIGLLLISLLICNIHVAVWAFYYILFLPYLAEGLISIIIKKCDKEKPIIKFINNKFDIRVDIPIKELLIIMLISPLTGLLTPIKDTPYTYLYKTMIGNSQKYILEHKASTLKESIFTIVLVVETLILGILSKIKLRDLFLLLGVALMSAMSVRHIGLFAVMIPLCASRTYNYFINHFEVDIDKLLFKLISKKIYAILILILIIVLSGLGLKKQLSKPYVDDINFPIEATEYIKKNLDYKNIRLYNEYNYGSYLLFNDIPVFIDSRADLYTKPFSKLDYDVFDDFMNIDNNFEEKFDFYRITHVLIHRQGSLYLNLVFNKKYKVLYEDSVFVLYERIIDNE